MGLFKKVVPLSRLLSLYINKRWSPLIADHDNFCVHPIGYKLLTLLSYYLRYDMLSVKWVLTKWVVITIVTLTTIVNITFCLFFGEHSDWSIWLCVCFSSRTGTVKDTNTTGPQIQTDFVELVVILSVRTLEIQVSS